MERLSNEEFKIIEPKQPETPVTIIQGIVDRRDKFTKSFWKNGGNFKSPLVQDLLELGEISRTDAVDLEFFTRLNKKEQMHYFNYIWSHYTSNLDAYSNICATLMQIFVKLRNDKIIIKDCIDMSKICAVPLKYKKDYNTMVQKVYNEKFLRKKNLTLAQNYIETFDKSYINEVDDILLDRKIVAKRAMKYGKRLDLYNIEMGSPQILFYKKALDVVNYSFPKNFEKDIKTFKKDIRSLRINLEREASKKEDTQSLVLY